MNCTEIVREIERLSSHEQEELYRTLGRLLKERALATDDADTSDRSKLAQAARVLLEDYRSDSELTTFTALDGDDVYEAR